MQIRFQLYFASSYGQELSLSVKHITESGKVIERDCAMNFQSDKCWVGSYDFSSKDNSGFIQYQYALLEGGKIVALDQWKFRTHQLDPQSAQTFVLLDHWLYEPIEYTVFHSKAFKDVLLKNKTRYKVSPVKKATHQFIVRIPALPEGKLLCMTGSGKILGDWNASNPILLGNLDDCWSVKLDLSKAVFPIEFKFATYDLADKKMEHFEEGPNHILESLPKKDEMVCFHHYAQIKKYAWKGAGVNVQVSSLRSEDSWGVGDFKDIEHLIEWSKATGIHMIQLLPINDTTAHHDHRDSYPYSAISAFALHPIFLNIAVMAKKHKIALPDSFTQEAFELNKKNTLEYDGVMKLKKKAIELLFNKCYSKYESKEDYVTFLTENASWLKPYAAFCYLRDLYETADFSKWENSAVFNNHLLENLTDSTKNHYPQIAIHYFVQYHLHNQLKNAVEKAHKAGIILKGDLPIGVGRYSVETWMHPHLFHMDMQAGAPPDAFTRKGQNWSFPTYNWEAMQKDGYHWWRQRLFHMSRYFDSTRIDHVLGFFRIWSIPLHAVEGIFGVFVPTISIHRSEFQQKGIAFDEGRLCKPYITDAILNELFSGNIDWVKAHVLNGLEFKSHLSNQRALDEHFGTDDNYLKARQGLFDLLANVILFKDSEKLDNYHFRISIHETSSFQNLSDDQKHNLDQLYVDYFYKRQDGLWYETAQTKFDAIQHGTNMMLCAEDLGMVPDMVEGILQQREMLALQVQRMPKRSHQQFSHPAEAPYLSVVTPSTHDMSTIREWWEENSDITQLFYNQQLGNAGAAPAFAEPSICKEIIVQHLQSPAMWAVFLLQDLMSMDEKTRRLFPSEDRINIPANPNHYWNYRMHITLEDLNECHSLTGVIHGLVTMSGRG